MRIRKSHYFVLVALFGLLIPIGVSNAQSSRSKSKSSSRRGGVKAIDVKAERVEQGFIREAFNLSKEYADAGQLEKSKKLLEAILKLDNSLEPVKEQIKKLDEEMMTSNAVDLKIKASSTWIGPVARVFKGKKFRMQTEGTFKLTGSITLDADGLSNEGPGAMITGQPAGALIGMIVKEDGKPGKPFAIKSAKEINPRDDGALMIRINVPGEMKCDGQFEVHLSGYVVTNAKPKSSKSKSSRSKK